MRNKNLTAAAAMATATALMLAGCATQKPAASSSEAASTAPAESSVVEETTPEEAPSEVTDVDEAAAEDLLLSTETMHYSADDEDGVVTVHKYDENGNEVFMREIDKASEYGHRYHQRAGRERQCPENGLLPQWRAKLSVHSGFQRPRGHD